MCTRYTSPDVPATERYFGVGSARNWVPGLQFSRGEGPFLRASAQRERELCVGRFGLIPWFSKTAELRFATLNARFEELTQKASYKDPWRRGQRCVVIADSFDEPCWETGRNVWWRFRRADGAPWALAGLWNRWVDPGSGEIIDSFTMLTLNADQHPLMARMHKPDPKLPPDAQDKRSVVPLDLADVDRWLHARPEEAAALVRLAPADWFDARPLDAATPALF